MRKLLCAVAASGVTALALGSPASFAQQTVPASAAENSGLWFVELAGLPTADGNTLAKVRSEKAAFRKAAKAAGIKYTERRAYDVLFNGFSVAITASARDKLGRLPGVTGLYPVINVAAPTPEQAAGSTLDLVSAISMTGARAAQDVRGLTGNGLKVGVIDTGIDIDHPAFGGGGTPGTTAFPSARVAYGYDFVGDAYDAGGALGSPTPTPDPNPDDCGGHGTHVAGIVGGDGAGIRGVAPKVTFGAYRVFGCAGSSSSEIIISAMERAYADGMDIINQSLGAARQWPQYPTAVAASRLVGKGVVMVASIGNNGPGGSSPDALFAAGAPGVGNSVIGVASFDNAQRSFIVETTPYGFSPATGSPLPPTSGGLDLVRTGTTSTTDDACAALGAGSLAGKAVLVRRGTCGFFIKASNAMNAGAAAVVLYNNAAGGINASVVGTPPITIPVVSVTAAQGAALDGLIAAGNTSLAWDDDYVSYPYGTGGLISGFSSFGLAADLSFKPNIGAPGGGIFSSYPLELGGTAALSGTSMSAPHVAGAVALILEAKPSLPAKVIEARLMNSADPKAWSGNPDLGFLDHSFRQGAGMLDILGVLDATTVVEPAKIAVGESEGGPRTFTITVKNQANQPVTYDLSHVAGLAAGPNTTTGASYATSGIFSGPATVSFGTPSVVVPKKGKATFTVTMDANPGLPNRSLYGGYIVLTPQAGGALYRVPFAGFKGDYQSTPVLTPTANGFPWLASLSGGTFTNQPAGATFTLAGGDIPYLLLHFDHLSRRVKMEAFDAVTGQNWHRVSDDRFFTRSSTPGGFFSFSWDGTTFGGTGTNPGRTFVVPNGQYVIKVTVIKALGESDNDAHKEFWTSPVITIARP